MNNNTNEYPWEGMLIVSVLGIIGGFILFITGCFSITTYEELYEYISVYGFGVIISLFFIGVAIYCWFLFFRSSISKPKKVVLYSLRMEDGIVLLLIEKVKYFYFLIVR